MLLKYGMIGDEVKSLQKHTSTTRLPRLPNDSLFDPITMARVMEFQHQVGITTDGIVGRRHAPAPEQRPHAAAK